MMMIDHRSAIHYIRSLSFVLMLCVTNPLNALNKSIYKYMITKLMLAITICILTNISTGHLERMKYILKIRYTHTQHLYHIKYPQYFRLEAALYCMCVYIIHKQRLQTNKPCKTVVKDTHEYISKYYLTDQSIWVCNLFIISEYRQTTANNKKLAVFRIQPAGIHKFYVEYVVITVDFLLLNGSLPHWSSSSAFTTVPFLSPYISMSLQCNHTIQSKQIATNGHQIDPRRLFVKLAVASPSALYVSLFHITHVLSMMYLKIIGPGMKAGRLTIHTLKPCAKALSASGTALWLIQFGRLNILHRSQLFDSSREHTWMTTSYYQSGRKRPTS